MSGRYLHLSRSGQRDAHGCELLELELRDSGHKRIDSVRVVSGAPGRQVFRVRADEVAQRDEPIPEGIYAPLGPVEWAGRVGDYSAAWSAALGPVWIDLYPGRAIGLHLDGNRSYAPGSAGCVCPLSMGDLRRIVDWWGSGHPDRLVVDWGLGSVLAQSREPRRWKLFSHSGKLKIFHDETEQPSGRLVVDAHSGRVGVVLAGKEVEPIAVTIEVVYQPG